MEGVWCGHRARRLPNPVGTHGQAPGVTFAKLTEDGTGRHRNPDAGWHQAPG